MSGLLLIGLLFPSCNSRNHSAIIKVKNSLPKYSTQSFVALQKLYDIDVTQISMFSKNYAYERLIAFDELDNMYILDGYEGIVSVFDKEGKIIRTFGGTGQAPREFQRPNTLIIKNNRIYVFQGFNEYKILSLDGEYFSGGLIQIENPLKFKAVGDSIYLFRGKTDRKFLVLDLSLTIIDKDLAYNKEIFTYSYPPGLRGPNYDFRFDNWLLISENGEFYFPKDNLNEYSIIKYSKEGKPELEFGRSYQVKEYSKEARDRFNSIYEKEIRRGDMVFPKAPPVIGNLFQDSSKNIWVISGETYEDNRNPLFENTIDLFSDKGKWLYSFKSKILSRYWLYHNDRVYRVLPMDIDNYRQHIEVYKINYSAN